MNRITTAAVCFLASLIVVTSAPAQKRAVRVVIPFAFSASGTQLPAGVYTIEIQGAFTSIRNGAGKSTLVNTIPTTDNLPDDSKVIFSIQGDQHFLRKIVCPALNISLELLPSEAEIKAPVQTGTHSGS